MKQIGVVVLMLALINFTACGIFVPMANSTSRLSDIKLKMSKEEVLNKLGEPNAYRGSITNETNQTVSVLQYKMYSPSQPVANLFLGILLFTVPWWLPLPNQAIYYWLYFVDDILAQWGQAGDWQEDVLMKVKLEQR